MSEEVKEFLEEYIELLDYNLWDEFLYKAYLYVDDTGALVNVLELSDIEFKSHLQSAFEYHMRKDDTLRSSKRVKLDVWRRIYPTYGLSDTEWTRTFITALKNVYPSKIIEA